MLPDEAANEPLCPSDNEKQIKKNREASDEAELHTYCKRYQIADEVTDVEIFNNLFGDSYVELSLGKPFDRNRGSTSLLTWIEKLESREMYSGVDFEVMREFTKEFYAIHKSGYIHAATYDLGKGRGSIDYFFKTQSDLNQSHTSSLGPVAYLVEKKSYDERLFSLCSLIGTRWYEDSTNLYNLSGFLCKRTQSDWHLMRRTYLCILREKLGATQRFDVKEAINSFSSWFKSPYHPKLSEGKLKAIAGGSNTQGYKEWKTKYEISEQRNETDGKLPRSQQLKQMLLERLEGNYRRDFGTGVVYERSSNRVPAACSESRAAEPEDNEETHQHHTGELGLPRHANIYSAAAYAEWSKSKTACPIARESAHHLSGAYPWLHRYGP